MILLLLVLGHAIPHNCRLQTKKIDYYTNRRPRAGHDRSIGAFSKSRPTSHSRVSGCPHHHPPGHHLTRPCGELDGRVCQLQRFWNSGIEAAPAEGIEALVSAEKLQGTDFCVGAIDAIMWP